MDRLHRLLLTVRSVVSGGIGIIQWWLDQTISSTLLTPAKPQGGSLTYKELLAKHELQIKSEGGIPDGWVPLVDKLILSLRRLGWDGRVDLIKSKNGELRFYIPPQSSSPNIKAQILAAEAKSRSICENCGDSGSQTVFHTGEVRTLCLVCSNVAQKKSLEGFIP
jgi:hypothetical protein